MVSQNIENITLQTLSDQLQKSILPNELVKYDYIVFTDGSGSTIDLSMGWAMLLFNVKTSWHTRYAGYLSAGTVNQSELLGVCSILQILDAEGVKQGRLLVVSDSEVTVRCGQNEYARNANKGLWAMLDYYESNGFDVDFMWVKRNSNDYNKWCDKQSKEIRQKNK